MVEATELTTTREFAADRLDEAVAREARGYTDEGVSRTRRYGSYGEVIGSELAVYVQAFASQPKLLICGATDYSTPEETAVLILAEMIAARTGRSGASLGHTIGPIHTEAEAAPGSEKREAL